MNKGQISLTLIVKDETDSLRQLLHSVVDPQTGKTPFSEIVVGWNGTNPMTKQILEQWGCKIVPFEWKDDFAYARNLVNEQASGEFLMWLDADDELKNVQDLLHICAEAFIDPTCYAIWMPYEYDYDKYDNVCMTLWRERVVRVGTHKWVGAIHESMLPTVDGHNFRTKKVYVKHNVDHTRVQRSGKRNLQISKKDYERMQKREIPLDPRIIHNYAKSLDAMGFYREAIPFFEEYLRESEWDDERYLTFIQLSKLYTNSKQYSKAIDMALHAMRLRPLYGQSYFQLAHVFFRMEKWEEVVMLCNMGKLGKVPDDIIPTDPTEYTIKPALIYELALFHMGNAVDSLKVIEDTLLLCPKHEVLLKRREFVRKFLAQMELEKSAHTLGMFLEKHEPKKLSPFLDSLPEVVSDHPDFLRIKADISDSGMPVGKGKRIAIYCHGTFEAWGPSTAKTKGLGGSEEAVVYLSKELVKLGWAVDVYNTCEREGQYDGVNYYNFWRFSSKKPYEIFIAWRNNEYVELANVFSRKFVWMHDVTKSEYWSKTRTDKIEKVFWLSKWHRGNLPELPEKKCFYTSNGINPSDFALAGSLTRDPYKCIYASSPDRGLDILLDIWKDIEKEVPDAHLHIFYGFTHTYDMLHANNSRMVEYKERIMRQIEKHPSIHYHGKVTHAELHEHFMSAGLWIYPTHFTEISCITAMKAQASGMVPVCTSLAALDETVKYGYKVDFPIQDERAILAIRNMSTSLLKDHKKQDRNRQKMMDWAKKTYSWSNVAKQWDELFRRQGKVR